MKNYFYYQEVSVDQEAVAVRMVGVTDHLHSHLDHYQVEEDHSPHA